MTKMKDSGIQWIGEIPEDWKVCKQKYVMRLLNGRAYKDTEFEENGKYKILRIGNLSTNSQWYTSSLELESDKYCEDGDLLYSWSMSYAPVIWHGEKVIYHYHIWKTVLKKNLDKKFAYYYLLTLTNAIKSEVHETTMGFITMGVMNNSYIALPPLEIQKRIADFLDGKCGKIDSLKSDIQKQIETLELYKKSVITEAVTKGINSNAKMKDSGIEWIGEIPEHWERTRLEYCCKKMGRTFSSNACALICSNKGEVILRGENSIGLISDDDNMYQGVKSGDLLIHGMDTWHGAIGVSELEGKCTRVVHVCESSENKYFICYYLQSLAFKNVYKAISNGVRENTSDFRSWEKAGHIPIFLPPRNEQNEIANYLNKLIQNIKVIIASKQKQLETLEEYKKSLIFEYVTGKKEVE